MFLEAYSVLGVGLLLGMRHATDSDHVVTITTIVKVEDGLRAALRVAVAWGLGHTATFFCMGAAIVFFGWQVPEQLETVTELAVAVLLLALGLAPWVRRKIPHTHHHEAGAPPQRARLGRPFFAGLVHGLAGSAGVALLVLTTIHDTPSRLGYLLLFGLGTITGMCALTCGVMVPVRALFGARETWLRRLHALACATSVALGGYMAWGALL